MPPLLRVVFHDQSSGRGVIEDPLHQVAAADLRKGRVRYGPGDGRSLDQFDVRLTLPARDSGAAGRGTIARIRDDSVHHFDGQGAVASSREEPGPGGDDQFACATDEMLMYFRDEGVKVSTSLDGPAFLHNKN